MGLLQTYVRNYVLRADGSRMISKAIWYLWSELFWPHQHSWRRQFWLFMWYENWLGCMKMFLPLQTGNIKKRKKDEGQKTSKVNSFWDFLTFNTWRQWLIFLERFSSVLPEMFRCFFCDISQSTKISTFSTRKNKKVTVFTLSISYSKKGNLDFISDELVKIKV